MSTELSISDLIPDAEPTEAAEKAVLSLSKASGYLPYLQVCGSNSNAVKDEKIKMGVLGLTEGDTIEDLGKELDLVLVAYRAKATVFGETPVSYYNPETPEFKTTMSRALNEGFGSGCVFGGEFLLWIPNRNHGKGAFCTLHMNSKSGRREVPNMLKLMKRADGKSGPTAVTGKVSMVDNGTYKWHVVNFTKCNTPIDTTVIDKDELTKVYNTFTHPKDSEVEVATGDAGQRAR